MPQTSDVLEKSALIFLYNFQHEHSWLKLIIKKLSPKINVKNMKNRVFFVFFLASFGHLGLISDPLIVSKLHNETYYPKGQENKIYTIVKGRETFYRRQPSVLRGVYIGYSAETNSTSHYAAFYHGNCCVLTNCSFTI